MGLLRMLAFPITGPFGSPGLCATKLSGGFMRSIQFAPKWMSWPSGTTLDGSLMNPSSKKSSICFSD